LSANTLRSLYFVLVHPYYEYANIVWAVRNNVVLQKLFIAQKRAVNIINSPWNAHTYPLPQKQVYLQSRNYVNCRWHVLCLKWIKVLWLHLS